MSGFGISHPSTAAWFAVPFPVRRSAAQQEYLAGNLSGKYQVLDAVTLVFYVYDSVINSMVRGHKWFDRPSEREGESEQLQRCNSEQVLARRCLLR